jgi:hypothetical protein
MRVSLKTLKYLPRILAFTLGKIGYHHRIDRFWRHQKPKLDEFTIENLKQMSDKDTLEYIKELLRLTWT